MGNAVADALAKKGASVFLAANDWVKMDQIAWAVPQRIYATRTLAAQAAPRSVSAHLGDVLLAARRIRKRERTILENASTHSLVPVDRGVIAVGVRTLHQSVVRWIGSQHHLLRTAQLSSIRSCARWASDATRIAHRSVYWSCGQIAQPELLGWSMNALVT